MREIGVFLGYVFLALWFALLGGMILAALASAPPAGAVLIIYALWRMFNR
jgi:hypothetical protein